MPIERKQFALTMLQDQHKLLAYILARGGGHDLAEDVVQDVLILALERMETFNNTDHLRAWCREAARRKFLERLRKDNRQPVAIDSAVLDLLEPHYQQLDATEGNDALEALNRCLTQISPNARVILDARYREGLTGEDLANAVGRKFNTVYSALSRVHKALGDCVRNRLAEVSRD
jgi:RNA polymerase sigma-70 factor, ECF subfamily